MPWRSGCAASQRSWPQGRIALDSLILVGLLLALFVLSTPVAVAFGLTATAFLVLLTDIPLTLIPQQMFAGTDSTVLQAVPFFLLAGVLMDKGGISIRLITFPNRRVAG